MIKKIIFSSIFLFSTINLSEGSLPKFKIKKKVIKPYKFPKFKNNNPFNIRKNHNNDWLGKVDSDNSFERFNDTESGIRAGIKLLSNYINVFGWNTITMLLTHYAPNIENNTEQYIKNVEYLMQVDRNEELSNRELMSLCKAIVECETGKIIEDKLLKQIWEKETGEERKEQESLHY